MLEKLPQPTPSRWFRTACQSTSLPSCSHVVGSQSGKSRQAMDKQNSAFQAQIQVEKMEHSQKSSKCTKSWTYK
jgi:hypothetical protein